MEPGNTGRWMIRKSLHLGVYGVFGTLLAMSLGTAGGWRSIGVLCFVVALGDEMHQAATPHRTFRWQDIGLDVVGAFVGAFLVWLAAAVRGDASRGRQDST